MNTRASDSHSKMLIENPATMNNTDGSPSATFFQLEGIHLSERERERESLSPIPPALAMSVVLSNNIRVLGQAASQLLQKSKPGLAETRRDVYLNHVYLNIWKLLAELTWLQSLFRFSVYEKQEYKVEKDS